MGGKRAYITEPGAGKLYAVQPGYYSERFLDGN
jgi:hypothetical protein